MREKPVNVCYFFLLFLLLFFGPGGLHLKISMFGNVFDNGKNKHFKSEKEVISLKIDTWQRV